MEGNLFDVKVCLIGTSSGKSSLIYRYVKSEYPPPSSKSIGPTFTAKVLRTLRKRLLLWDIPGDIRYSSLLPVYLNGSSAILIVYDVTSRQSFESLPLFLDHANQARRPGVLLVIVGSKADSPPQRTVSFEEGADLARSMDAAFVEVSAKSGLGVEGVFGLVTKVAESSMFESCAYSTDLSLGLPR